MAELVAPTPGTVLHLTEQQYKFGRGPLLCKVQQVITLVLFDDHPWWHLRGQCADGTAANHGGWHDRELYVIATALRPERRPATPRGRKPR